MVCGFRGHIILAYTQQTAFRVLDPPQVLKERYNCYKGHPGSLYGQMDISDIYTIYNGYIYTYQG